MESNKIKSRTGFRLKTSSEEIKTIDLQKNHIPLIEKKILRNRFSRIKTIERFTEIQKTYLKNTYWGFSKRIFDIILSSTVVVLILSWIYPLLFILIKLESKGPVIFVQKRSGLDGNAFSCYKFRSMIGNYDSDILPTFKNDPRVTKTGTIIRRFNLDEFPQFINVLKGDMSIVGPRPHMLSETNNFSKMSSDFYKRHKVKPGITGLAQINGCRGVINNYNDLSNRIKYDLFYIKKASFRYDLIIVYKTFLKMLCGGDPKAI